MLSLLIFPHHTFFFCSNKFSDNYQKVIFHIYLACSPMADKLCLVAWSLLAHHETRSPHGQRSEVRGQRTWEPEICLGLRASQ